LIKIIFGAFTKPNSIDQVVKLIKMEAKFVKQYLTQKSKKAFFSRFIKAFDNQLRDNENGGLVSLIISIYKSVGLKLTEQDGRLIIEA